MKRREFLQCAAILVSGVSASRLGFSLSGEQQQYLATAPNFNTLDVDYFSPGQRTLVAALAEAIIPRTDTPGAIDAGVPRFLELMVALWLNDEERAIFNAGLADLETRVPARYGKPFVELDAGTQLKVLQRLERAALDSPWYDFGNVVRDYISDAPFICHLKELTVWGFFTSEVGGRQVLRHDPMPMFFDGDIPLDPDESTWTSIYFF